MNFLTDFWNRLVDNAKFAAALVALLWAFLVSAVPELAGFEDTLTEVIAILVAYILGRGFSERG